MKKSVWIFGTVLGTVLCANMIYMVHLCYTKPDFESNDLVGYAALVVMFSLIFFGVRDYRNKQLDGVISFGKALKTGLMIALVGSIMYVVVWLFCYYLFVPDYLDKYIPHVIKKTAENGATATELAAKEKEMDNFKEMYKNPFFVIIITFLEVFPVGLVVALASALILKKRRIADVN